MDARKSSAAALRNRGPILEVLARHVRPGDHVVEIASGSGEHALFLAAHLPVASWQPTDPDPEARASIAAWLAEAPVPAVRPPLALDVRERPWPVATADVLVAINMVHISPWAATEALFEGAAALGPRVVYLYGPYRRDGAHTAPSNEAFDGWLKARDPAYGVRDLEAVLDVAARAGFALTELVAMPANNFSVVLRRR